MSLTRNARTRTRRTPAKPQLATVIPFKFPSTSCESSLRLDREIKAAETLAETPASHDEVEKALARLAQAERDVFLACVWEGSDGSTYAHPLLAFANVTTVTLPRLREAFRRLHHMLKQREMAAEIIDLNAVRTALRIHARRVAT